MCNGSWTTTRETRQVLHDRSNELDYYMVISGMYGWGSIVQYSVVHIVKFSIKIIIRTTVLREGIRPDTKGYDTVYMLVQSNP